MKPRTAAVLLSLALVAYFLLLGQRAVALIRAGTPVAVGLGIGTILLPVLGAILLFFELRFGWRTQQLGRQLEREGGLPDVSGLPRLASGRVDKKAALPHFQAMKDQVETNPHDWRGWFRLADAYDLAGDRRRAREAMRTAIQLSRP